MSYSVEKTGRTTQEAIQLALDELKIDESKAKIEVLDEGAKGLFGIIGNKVAKVRVTVNETQGDCAIKFLMDVLGRMDVDAFIDVSEDDDSIMLNIEGKDIGILIGRRGETLDSLQYLTSLVVNKNKGSYKRVILDIENYRQKREETLVRLADRLAEKVVRYKNAITLEPMNPYERRIIHSSLQYDKFVETYSVGDEPNRKVVITLK